MIRRILSALLTRLAAAFAPGQVPDEPLPPDALPDGREPPDHAALDAEEEAWFVGATTEPAPCEACRAGTVGMPCLHTCSHRDSFLGRRS